MHLIETIFRFYYIVSLPWVWVLVWVVEERLEVTTIFGGNTIVKPCQFYNTMIARVKEMSSARGRKNSGTGSSPSIWPPEKLPKKISTV